MRKYNALYLKEPVTIHAKEIKFFDAAKGADIGRDDDFYIVHFDGLVREVPASNVRWAEPGTVAQLVDMATETLPTKPRARAKAAEEARLAS